MTDSPIGSPRTLALGLPLQGASNFRDLGGYVGAGGRKVRFGRIFRSDHLAALTHTDMARLQTLQVTHSIDFRGVAESALHPYGIVGLKTSAMPIEPTVVKRVTALLERGQVPTTDETVALMCDTYTGFVHEHGPTFGRFLRHLLAHPTPTVFHCTAGKDRTGFAAALLLSLLGVDRPTIMEDYLLTNRLYRRSPLIEGAGPAHVLAVLWQVQPAFLQAALDTMESEYGGVAAYACGPAGLSATDCEHLRETLLEH